MTDEHYMRLAIAEAKKAEANFTVYANALGEIQIKAAHDPAIKNVLFGQHTSAVDKELHPSGKQEWMAKQQKVTSYLAAIGISEESVVDLRSSGPGIASCVLDSESKTIYHCDAPPIKIHP